MTYVFVQDIAASWEQYQRFAAAAIDPVPQGVILHLAGPTEEGFRIIGVWESEMAWRLFKAQRLQPAIAALGGPSRPHSTFRDLHPAHVITGLQRPTRRQTDRTPAIDTSGNAVELTNPNRTTTTRRQ